MPVALLVMQQICKVFCLMLHTRNAPAAKNASCRLSCDYRSPVGNEWQRTQLNTFPPTSTHTRCSATTYTAFCFVLHFEWQRHILFKTCSNCFCGYCSSSRLAAVTKGCCLLDDGSRKTQLICITVASAIVGFYDVASNSWTPSKVIQYRFARRPLTPQFDSSGKMYDRGLRNTNTSIYKWVCA